MNVNARRSSLHVYIEKIAQSRMAVESIVEALVRVGGKRKLAIFRRAEEHSTLYLLFDEQVIISAALLEHKRNTTWIALVDSTGYCRGYTGAFILGIVKSIMGLIVCFSYPKEEPIFCGSSTNPGKQPLAPAALFRYWTGIFEQRCDMEKAARENHMKDAMEKEANGCQDNGGTAKEESCYFATWSNFRKADRRFPYQNLNDIVRFRDDPKRKLLREFRKAGHLSTQDFVNALLVRTDFTKGGLLFSHCTCTKHRPTTSSAKTESGKCATEPPNGTVYKSLSGSQNTSIASMIRFLRSHDFSNLGAAAASTQLFVDTFQVTLSFFETDDSRATQRARQVQNGTGAVRIIPRTW